MIESDVWAVLFVPSPEHSKNLIGEGPCGSRAPLAWTPDQDQVPEGFLRTLVGVWQAAGHRPVSPLHTPALVLFWEGKPVLDGIFRAWNWWEPDNDPQDEPGEMCDVLFDSCIENVLSLAASCERCGLGRVVLLGVAGREMTLHSLLAGESNVS